MFCRTKLPHLAATVNSVATVLLLVAGALVTSTGSGLSVPDWPLSYGTLFPEMKGGVFFEHGHRLIAGGVLILTLFQTYVFMKWESRGWVRLVCLMALSMVLCQAALGGLTVLLRLPPEVSVAHACLAQLFFCAEVTLCFVTSRSWNRGPSPFQSQDRFPGIAMASAVLTALFFFQLLAGAIMRHTGAALAIPDFPLVFGGFIPSDFQDGVLIHYLHRMGGFLLAFLSAGLSFFLFRRLSSHLDVIRWVGILLSLISIQILLGASIVLLKRPINITSAHLAVGALCFASSLVLTLRLGRLTWGRLTLSPRPVTFPDTESGKGRGAEWVPA